MNDSTWNETRKRGAVLLAALVLVFAPACLAASHEAHEGGTSHEGHGGDESHEGHAEAASEPVGVEAIDVFIAKQEIDKSNPRWKLKLPKPPKVAFDDDATYYWMLDTNVGNMKVKLMPDVAPMHVSSTLYLTQLGFYDDILFHRVIPGFMAQSGDPTGTGTSGPGYQYAGEFDKDVKHDKGGLLSMANRGPGTDSSQFFLTFVPTPHLNGKHTIFGEVVEGRGTLKALEKRGSRRGKTSERLLIEKATILVE
ncbi:MAG: peptidylprolyl isomerase [Myxococcota bacterium]